jgi:anion transporter
MHKRLFVFYKTKNLCYDAITETKLRSEVSKPVKIIKEERNMSPAVITLIFLAFAVVMFVTEKIPLGLTSMIVCVGLVLTGVLDVNAAFKGFINSNVILFVAMFIVGGALFETGMANEIGGIVTKFAKTERSLIIAIMLIVGLMSGVLSNTGTAAVLIPVVIGISAKSGFKRSRLLMPLVFAAAMGGNLSLIGAPGNMIAQSALEPLGLKFGFFEYAIVGLPILVCGILFYATVGFRLLPNHETTDDGASVFDDQKDFSKVPQWKKTLSLVILIATLAAMIFEDQIGIKLCISGCIGAILLILTGVISEKEALRSIDLKTILRFVGTLSLAAALQDTGAGEMIAGKVIGALGSNPSPLIFTFVVFILCCVMTNFMSNTATTALMAPICLSIAQGMGADPRAVLMACVIGGSCAYATPIGMPANTMVVGAGGYKFMDYVKSGLPLIIIATVVSMIILPIAFPFYP